MPVIDEVARRAQGGDIGLPHVLSDGIINDGNTRPAGHGGDLRGDIAGARVDHVVAAAGARDVDLVVAAHRADDGRAQRLRPLAQQRAHAARRGMDQHGVARLHAPGLAQQVLRRHAAQQRAGDIPGLDPRRDRNERVRGDEAFFGIGAEDKQVTGRIARLERGHALAHRLDDAGAVEPHDGGQVGFEEILALAQHGVGEMQGHAFLVEQNLAGTGRADLVVFDLELVGAAIGVNANDLGHEIFPLKYGYVIGRLVEILMAGGPRLHLRRSGVVMGAAHMFARAVLPDRPQPVDRSVALRPAFYDYPDHAILMRSGGARVKRTGNDRAPSAPVDQMDERAHDPPGPQPCGSEVGARRIGDRE